MRNVDLLARSIAIAEGYQDYEGNVLAKAPARRNNPGSLRASSFENKKLNGYCVFPSAEIGWKALYRQIALDRDRKLTLEQFIYKFAPPSENRTELFYVPLVVRETKQLRTIRLNDWIEPYPPNHPTIPLTLPGLNPGTQL